jgi:4-diphosphocytidyl-2-C-methyl-D-erythritol kinase
MQVEEFAPAKVNLYLHVTGRRPDGYHLLDSLAVFPAAGDILHAAPADGLTLSITGPFGATLAAEADNLVLKAARALAAAAGIKPQASLTLAKHLPIASGIGGGSADAAAALRALSRLWNLTLPLAPIALTLGADVPVCLTSRPTVMSGIGEVLNPAPSLPAFWMVLINPGLAVPTPAVFRARTGPFSPAGALPAAWPDADSIAAHLQALANDLEPPAIALAPPIAGVLSALQTTESCLLARMSGSGATCFALYPTPEAATAAAARLTRPDWWIWSGGLADPPATGI